MINGKKKAAAVTAVLIICLSILCSFFFIAGCAGHDCTHDDDCAVCRVIDVCLDTIRGAAAGTVSPAAAAVLLIFIAVLVLHERAYSGDTLISLKVELRN